MLTRIFILGVSLLTALLLSGCSDSGLELTSIQITPDKMTTLGASGLTLAKGNSQPFIAIGTYKNETSADITESVTWWVSDNTIASIDANGIATGLAAGTAIIRATKADVDSNELVLTVTNAVLESIQVTPAQVSVAYGNSQQLIAIGSYSDNTTVNITSSVSWLPADPEVATVTPFGLLVSLGIGTTRVTASDSYITSNSVEVTVTDAVLESIQLTPSPVSVAVGYTQQLVAMGIYSDNTTADISSSVSWVPADPEVATVTPAGLLEGLGIGTTRVTASKSDITSNTVEATVTDAVLESIQVTPSPVSVAAGHTQQLVAMGIYSNNTTADISSSVFWIPANTEVATVTQAGLLVGFKVDTTEITAYKDNISATVNVSVTDAVLTAIEVTPAPLIVPNRYSQQLVAMGIFSDNTSVNITSSVSWMSAVPETATVDPLGEVVGVETGPTKIMAFKDNISATVNVIVTDVVLESIQVTPSPLSLASGNSQQLLAMGRFSDSTIFDIGNALIWLSVNPETASVSQLGLVMGVNPSTTMISAAIGQITTSVDVTITDAILESIQVTPSPVSVASGNSQQLVAMGSYSNNTAADVSNSVVWISVDPETATVSPLGLVTGVKTGTTEIQILRDNIREAVDVIVTDAVLEGF